MKDKLLDIYFSDPKATPTALARQFGTTTSTVHRWLRQARRAGRTFEW